MTYIGYINQFWQKNADEPFSFTESVLYFFLLHISNRNAWKNDFFCSNDVILSSVEMSLSSLKRARNTLKERQLIEFTTSSGRGNVSMYSLVPKPSKKGSEKGSQKGSEKGSQKGSQKGSNPQEKERSKEKEYLKTKDNKTSEIIHTHTCANIEPDPPLSPLYPITDIPLLLRQREQAWIELFCMNNKITLRDFNIFTDLFIQHLQCQGHKSKSLSDYQSYFHYWFLKQKDFNNAKSQTPRPTTRSEQRQQQSQEQHAAILSQVQQLDALYRSQSDSPETQDNIPDTLSLPPTLQSEPTDYPFD